MNPSTVGPTKTNMNNAKKELKIISEEEKHWLCGGDRSVAMAAELLQQGKVIAVPTDTIYGLAALASSNWAIQCLYEIKKRDEQKPLAICLSNVTDVPMWGIVDELPPNLLQTLLPGPYTVILRRTPALNPALNPGIESVGIRVPNSHFIRSVTKIVGPIALTSANVSSEPSSLHPKEFSILWPKLGGIFYTLEPRKSSDHRRIGSTVVDLTQPGCYRVVRRGIGAKYILSMLNNAGLNNTIAN